MLAERELRARYKQTRVGFAWALVTPFLMMVVFTVFFKRVADVNTFGVPYPLFSYVGLLSWTFFSGALAKGAVSIVQNLTLLNKVYCPREVFPISSVATAGVDTAIAVSILGVLFVIYRFMPHLASLWVPALMVVQLAFTIGLTLICSAAHRVRPRHPPAAPDGAPARAVRDAGRLRPRGHPASRGGRWYSALNPLAPVIDGYRRTVLFGLPTAPRPRRHRRRRRA